MKTLTEEEIQRARRVVEQNVASLSDKQVARHGKSREELIELAVKVRLNLLTS